VFREDKGTTLEKILGSLSCKDANYTICLLIVEIILTNNNIAILITSWLPRSLPRDSQCQLISIFILLEFNTISPSLYSSNLTPSLASNFLNPLHVILPSHSDSNCFQSLFMHFPFPCQSSIGRLSCCNSDSCLKSNMRSHSGQPINLGDSMWA